MAVEVIADPGATWRIPGESYERSWRRMEELIEVTANAGAQVFKPQLYTADIYPAGSAEHALLKPYEMPREWVPRLAQSCALVGLELMITVYVPEDVAFIDPYVKRFKVASFEATNIKLRQAIASIGKPVLWSTGTLSRASVVRNCDWWAPHVEHTPLHCVSAYPALPKQFRLTALLGWNVWGTPKTKEEVSRLDWSPDDVWVGAMWNDIHRMGLSDHSIGNTAAIMAVALGATVIEKHIRAVDTPPSNPDAPHSALPYDFACYVAAIREAEVMLGDGVKRVMPGEEVQWRYDPATGKRGVKA